MVKTKVSQLLPHRELLIGLPEAALTYRGVRIDPRSRACAADKTASAPEWNGYRIKVIRLVPGSCMVMSRPSYPCLRTRDGTHGASAFLRQSKRAKALRLLFDSS
jgi:hypothetical protein